MDAEQLGVLLAGISSILGVLIYFTKNIKESECLGSKCTQAVEIEKNVQETII
jgi:hypothetical protein